MLKQLATARAPSPTRDPPTQRFGVAGARAPGLCGRRGDRLYSRHPRHREAYFCAEAAISFWKRGSLRSGSNIGSIRSNAGVSGGFAANGASYGIESSLVKVEDSAVRIADASRDPGEDVERP